MLAYSETPAMLGNADPTPRIRVYSNGRVLVHFPVYMKKAGQYELWLSEAELEQLLTLASKLVGNDGAVASARLDEALQTEAEATGFAQYRSDSMIETLDLNIEKFKAGANVAATSMEETITWKHKEFSSAAYPQVQGLADMEALRNAIKEITSSDELEVVQP
ncbi:hypothetical protein EY643_02605 [Halioglobus maricola]|uniref:Uncharacterized protein n=1 Tax=Halioglobus maricola TaxID=2601894 RepID=A0A5P9NFQ1_9GAMM|nr:hypothetical protein [Halioglobus maricola]QFU74633.1 hypothetical protein EY643_02605 [Halioglobus maricola]